jgi:beta-N-acetylhexosaminidase
MSSADPHLMLAFEGTEVPDWLRARLAESPPAGVTLFREWNMASPEQVAELTVELQEANSSPLPLLIAIDQEGGQLLGLPGSTPFAGNMALGAAADIELARTVADRMGQELAAVGINVNYAPVADVASRPDNPSLGIRSFGDDPSAVADMTRAMIEGFHHGGVLATAKHFPGKGEAKVDPHYQLPLLDLDRDRLDSVELPPFRGAFEAGTDLLMMGHYVVPSITGSTDLPISASGQGIDGFVRAELGFRGLVITDALDMGALDQGPAQVVEVIAMMNGGTDLLLCMPDPALQDRVRVAVERGASRGLIPAGTLSASRLRIENLRRSIRVGPSRPEAVGDQEHLALARNLATRSLTVVRNDEAILPLRLGSETRILSLEPEPTNLTPADTTALYPPLLASALRSHHADVTDIVYPHDPRPSDIDGIVAMAENHDLIVIGTVAANPGQLDLVNALLSGAKPIITIALRTPYDLAGYSSAATHVCTYGTHAPTMSALGEVLFTGSRNGGALPVSIPDLYGRGHGLAV